jgi:hypothetical protein
MKSSRELYETKRSTEKCNLCAKISRKSQGNLRVTSPSCLPRQLALLSGNTKPKTGESCKRSCNIRPQKKPKWMIHEVIFTTKRAVKHFLEERNEEEIHSTS